MTGLAPRRIFDAIAATWPPMASYACGPFVVNAGRGGGSRVSAALAVAEAEPDDVTGAEAAMRDLGQTCLFRVTPSDGALDTLLAARGYAVMDPVVILAAPLRSRVAVDPTVGCIAIWPPTPAMLEVWAEGGIGPQRVAVMARVEGPRAAIWAEGAVAFVACDGDVAMLHALEVAQAHRRKGLARRVMAAAAEWAAAQGATTLALAVTRANAPALALYSSLGMTQVAEYHYRIFPD